MILLGVALAVLFGAAAGIRVWDAGFIAYARGDTAGAREGLFRRAEGGDGFAAFLLGRISLQAWVRHVGPERPDQRESGAGDAQANKIREEAATWFLKSARAGYAEAALWYPSAMAPRRKSKIFCAMELSILKQATKADMASAHVRLGHQFLYGWCVKRDRVVAVHHFGHAAPRARGFRNMYETARGHLSEAQRHRLAQLPKKTGTPLSREAFLKFFFELAAKHPPSSVRVDSPRTVGINPPIGSPP
jgi:TPR repeat protein